MIPPSAKKEIDTSDEYVRHSRGGCGSHICLSNQEGHGTGTAAVFLDHFGTEHHIAQNEFVRIRIDRVAPAEGRQKRK